MIAIYARVSTNDKGQDPEAQLYALRPWAKSYAKPLEVIREYVDYASATDQRGRKAWRQLLNDTHKGKVRLIGFLRLDRAFRNTADAILTCTDLAARGVDVVALNSPFDTTTPAGRLTLTIFAALAEFELDLIKTRVNEGLDRARAKGVRLGRPPGSRDKKPRKRRLAIEGSA